MEKLAAAQINFWRRKSWPKNWVLKLFSFFFALMLWYFVVGEDKVDMTVSIPVEIVNLPQNLIISNQFKNQLDITVNGPRGLIRRITDRHISRSIDLSDAKPGTIVVKNTPDSISLPRGVSLLRIKPTDIILEMDKLIEKTMPINAITKGKPQEGFELVTVKLDPPLLSVRGPRRILEKEKKFSTLPIEIEGINETTQLAASLDLSQEIIDFLGDQVVTAQIVIQEKRQKKTVKNIPIQINLKNPQINFDSLKPKSISVVAEIPLSLATATEKLSTLFSAKLKTENLSPGTHKVQVEVTATKGIKITSIDPGEATITIKDDSPEIPKGQGP
jgi:YbbR domain-containing protein